MSNSISKSLGWTLAHVAFFSGTAVTVKLASSVVAVPKQIFIRSLVTLCVRLLFRAAP